MQSLRSLRLRLAKQDCLVLVVLVGWWGALSHTLECVHISLQGRLISLRHEPPPLTSPSLLVDSNL